jgi:hypothetical protein
MSLARRFIKRRAVLSKVHRSDAAVAAAPTPPWSTLIQTMSAAA